MTGELEFYAESEGADNSGGGNNLFNGTEFNGAGTYPGYKFNLDAKLVEGVTGCTPIKIIRTGVTLGNVNTSFNIKTIKYGYTTGQSENAAFSTFRGGNDSEMIVIFKVEQIIGSGTTWYPIFEIKDVSVSGINKTRIDIDVNFASMLGSAYLLRHLTLSSSSQFASGQITFNCNNCIFSPALFSFLQTYTNYRVAITGNYYCSGVTTNSNGAGLNANILGYPFMLMWDQTNDGINDNSIIDFKGNYYTSHESRPNVTYWCKWRYYSITNKPQL